MLILLTKIIFYFSNMSIMEFRFWYIMATPILFFISKSNTNCISKFFLRFLLIYIFSKIIFCSCKVTFKFVTIFIEDGIPRLVFSTCLTFFTLAIRGSWTTNVFRCYMNLSTTTNITDRMKYFCSICFANSFLFGNYFWLWFWLYITWITST